MHALNSSSRQAEAGESEVEATLVYRASSERPKKSNTRKTKNESKSVTQKSFTTTHTRRVNSSTNGKTRELALQHEETERHVLETGASMANAPESPTEKPEAAGTSSREAR